jgi:protein-S-isoprenylcysteine O-methyltransferase Ste14
MINGMQICDYLWLTFFILWILAALSTKRAAETVDWGRRLYYGIPVVLAYYCMFSMDLDIPWLQKRVLPKTPELAIVTIVITIVGMALAVWARVYLGRNWSSAPTIKQQHQLIRGGPYRFVRHPIYTEPFVGDGWHVPGERKSSGRCRVGAAVVCLVDQEPDGGSIHDAHLRR